MQGRPARNKGELLGPSDAAISAAEFFSAKAKDRYAPVRRVFIDGEYGKPGSPMSTMLRGGQSGSVRLKLFLSMIWIAAGEGHHIGIPLRSWAQMFGLPNAEGHGQRRIMDAMKWLADNHFVAIKHRPGHSPLLTLQMEDGSGRPYRKPGKAMGEVTGDDEASQETRTRNSYLKVPPEFWTSGWVEVLSGRAVALLLALLSDLTKKMAAKSSRENVDIGEIDPETIGLWFSPSRVGDTFGLSEDTRSRGFAELVEWGLIRMERQAISRNIGEELRFRNVYFLNPEKLKTRPRRVAAA